MHIPRALIGPVMTYSGPRAEVPATPSGHASTQQVGARRSERPKFLAVSAMKRKPLIRPRREA
jgi:hypothetical protein